MAASQASGAKQQWSVEFQPGSLMGIHWTLEVAAVVPGSQAAALGVRPGWRVRTVDGQPPVLGELLLAWQSGFAPYRVAFDDRDAELPGGFRIGDRAELLIDLLAVDATDPEHRNRKGQVGIVLGRSDKDGWVLVELPSRIVEGPPWIFARKGGREEALANTGSASIHTGDRVVSKVTWSAQKMIRGEVGVVRGLGKRERYFGQGAAIEVEFQNNNAKSWPSDWLTSEPVAVELAERAALLSSRLKACEEELQSAKTELRKCKAELKGGNRGRDKLQKACEEELQSTKTELRKRKAELKDGNRGRDKLQKACEEQLQSAKTELRKREAELEDGKRDRDELQKACEEQLQSAKTELQRCKAELEDGKRDRALAIAAPLPWPSHYAEFGMSALAPDDPLCLFLSNLFRESCTSHRKDLHATEFCPPPQLEILQVEAVSNPRLMMEYHVKAASIQGLRAGGCAGIPQLAHLKLPARKGTSPSWPDLNEHLLFHGATADVVEKICRGGFDPRRGGEAAGRMFGLATYLAANASKSDIYTERLADRLAKGAPRKIILARVLLGESFRADRVAVASRGHRGMLDATRPPDGSDDRPLDSVWAPARQDGGAVDHLEAMIYDKGQAYPEVVITYTHAAACRCAECSKRP